MKKLAENYQRQPGLRCLNAAMAIEDSLGEWPLEFFRGLQQCPWFIRA